MISQAIANIDKLIVHKVGNKTKDEGVQFSKEPLQTDDAVSHLLLKYFFSPFKDEEYYRFYHESGLELNEMYQYAKTIFDDPDSIYEQSRNIAKHLYTRSNHPKIKTGELYVTYIQDCLVDGETVDAVGIFKSESKETYLKINPRTDGFEIRKEDGINIRKLDKGCLIFNVDREEGYLVAQVDNLSKQNEARYWCEDFLKINQLENSYFQTQNTLEMCKDFVEEKMSDEFEVTMVDKSDMLNKSAQFFKEKDSFDMGEFSEEVLQQPELVESFNNFKEEYSTEKNLVLEDQFDISNSAVKKQSRFFKSVIKLDKNFHVYVHGNKENIVSGYDEARGMHYYQLFYNEEN